MKKISKNSAGFSAVELLLVVIVVGLLAFGGWLIWQKNKDDKESNKKSASSSQSEAKKKPTTPAPTTPFVNVIQANDTVTQVTPDKIAKTADQTNILKALHDTCKGSSIYVTVNHAVFDGTVNYAQDGSYASINAGVCNDLAKTLDDAGGNARRNYLHKNSSAAWVLDTSSQTVPSCEKVDGLGYPASIISACWDGSAERAPQ